MRATSSPGPSGRADNDGAAQPLPPEDTSVYTDPQATPQELAAHLPNWAAEMMLDETSNAAYETDQVRQRASASPYPPINTVQFLMSDDRPGARK